MINMMKYFLKMEMGGKVHSKGHCNLEVKDILLFSFAI